MRTYFTEAYDLLSKHRQELWLAISENSKHLKALVEKQKDEWDEFQRRYI